MFNFRILLTNIIKSNKVDHSFLNNKKLGEFWFYYFLSYKQILELGHLIQFCITICIGNFFFHQLLILKILIIPLFFVQ